MTPSGTAADIRHFCFTCHTTGDAGITKGWNGSAMVTITAGARLEGIDRTVYNASGSHLKLPPSGPAHACRHSLVLRLPRQGLHGAGTNNVHNPSGGVSAGGQDCYTCHTSLQGDDGRRRDTAKSGQLPPRAWYRDASPTTGDTAFSRPAPTPAPTTDVYCLSLPRRPRQVQRGQGRQPAHRHHGRRPGDGDRDRLLDRRPTPACARPATPTSLAKDTRQPEERRLGRPRQDRGRLAAPTSSAPRRTTTSRPPATTTRPRSAPTARSATTTSRPRPTRPRPPVHGPLLGHRATSCPPSAAP